jgi:hypothetical protein
LEDGAGDTVGVEVGVGLVLVVEVVEQPAMIRLARIMRETGSSNHFLTSFVKFFTPFLIIQNVWAPIFNSPFYYGKGFSLNEQTSFYFPHHKA